MTDIPEEALLHRQLRDASYKIKIINRTKITVWWKTVGTDHLNKNNEYSQTENGGY